MSRLVAAAILAGIGVAGLARGQDFGDFLEKAARDSLQRSFSPEAIEKALSPDERGKIYTVKTADGWTLVAHRYQARPGGKGGGAPVILCHGLTYSARFWDLEPPVSFARFLADRGYDVWAIDLRGCGMSQKWVFKLDTAPDALIGGAIRRATRNQVMPTGFTSIDPKYANWTLDSHIAHDVPAFVRLVRHHTGASEVTWIGHSMGGIVALAHLARAGNPGIGKLITVGSQVTMNNGQLVLPFLEQMILTRQGQLSGKITGAEIAQQAKTSTHNLFFNLRHVAPSVYQLLGDEATDIPALGLMKQYTALATRGELTDSAGTFNYARALGAVKVPILITCGASDVFAPPDVQQYLFDHVGSTDKTLIVFGRRQGFAEDAGHNDALVGLTSRQQVYPILERWLRGDRFRPDPKPADGGTARGASARSAAR